MTAFIQNQPITVTSCNHAFHKKCLMEWVNQQVAKIVKDNLKTEPECPNCKVSLLKEIEENAIDQLMGMLS